MKANKKKMSGSLRVDPEILKETKKVCADLEVSIGDYASEALKEKNTKELVKLAKK